MYRIDLKLPSAAEYLAADEALLDWAEAGRAGEMLVFWEPSETFVVVGYANKVSTEVNEAACQQQGVRIFRRCSGGGTVVQMPGSLNYSLILRITEEGPTRNISSANHFIMEKNRVAVQNALKTPDVEVSVRGHTDLAVCTPQSALDAPKKVAGNAQRRRKHFLLFHGTLLLDCDLKRIGELLQMPSHQPDYRASRTHGDFVTNLNLPVAAIKHALALEWKAHERLEALPLNEIQRLAREKYETKDWNYKF